MREEEGLAAGALETLGVTAERARAQVVRLVRPGDEGTVNHVGLVPFTPRAKKVLERSLRESLSLGRHNIGPEHILLALVREKDGVAVRILLEFDADAEKVRNELLRVVPDPSPQTPGPGPLAVRAITDVVPWHTTDQSWFGELGAHMNGFAKAIRRELARAPDTGDLLLALACAPDTVAAQTLRELGIDLDQLQAAIEGKRGQPPAAQNQADEPEGSEHQRRQAQAREDAIARPEVLQEIRPRLRIANPAEPPTTAG